MWRYKKRLRFCKASAIYAYSNAKIQNYTSFFTVKHTSIDDFRMHITKCLSFNSRSLHPLPPIYWKIYWITKCTTNDYSFPLFSSLLKKRHGEKEIVLAKPVSNKFFSDPFYFQLLLKINYSLQAKEFLTKVSCRWVRIEWTWFWFIFVSLRVDHRLGIISIISWQVGAVAWSWQVGAVPWSWQVGAVPWSRRFLFCVRGTR